MQATKHSLRGIAATALAFTAGSVATAIQWIYGEAYFYTVFVPVIVTGALAASFIEYRWWFVYSAAGIAPAIGAILVSMFVMGNPDPFGVIAVGFMLGVGAFSTIGPLFVFVAKSEQRCKYLRHKRLTEGQWCQHCEYPVPHESATRCPECGKPYESQQESR